MSKRLRTRLTSLKLSGLNRQKTVPTLSPALPELRDPIWPSGRTPALPPQNVLPKQEERDGRDETVRSARVAPACDLLPKMGARLASQPRLVPPLLWRLGWMRPLPRARMMSDYKVALVDDNPSDIYVVFHGPKDSALSPPACLPWVHPPPT